MTNLPTHFHSSHGFAAYFHDSNAQNYHTFYCRLTHYCIQMTYIIFGGKFLKNLLCRVDEGYNKIIRFYQSIWRCKSATVKSFEADASSVSHSSVFIHASRWKSADVDRYHLKQFNEADDCSLIEKENFFSKTLTWFIFRVFHTFDLMGCLPFIGRPLFSVDIHPDGSRLSFHVFCLSRF